MKSEALNTKQLNVLKTILGSTLEELKGIVSQFGLPAFTAKQIADWLYKKHVRSIDQMTNLSQKARAALSEQFTIGVSDPGHISTSADGTEKYLFQVGDKHHIESVFIPEKDRATLCISSQMGCQMKLTISFHLLILLILAVS